MYLLNIYALLNPMLILFNHEIFLHTFSFIAARSGSKALTNLTSNERAQIIYQLAELIQENHADILAANAKDMNAANLDGSMATSMISRLALTPQKLNVLSEGLRQIAEDSKELLGRPIRATRIADGLDLHQITVPIGVLLVIFESRPDCLPQANYIQYYLLFINILWNLFSF